MGSMTATTEPKFAIPEEYQKDLIYSPPTDARSDAEIISAINQFQPVQGEKNIWAFWHAGFDAMHDWTKRNILAWVRMNPGWAIRVLDSVEDSPNYALKYVSAEMLPQAFVEGKMDGPYVGPHSADFLRGACLYVHGGVFMDVGILLCRSLDRIFWKQLEDPQSPYNVAIPWMYSIMTGNHVVAARKGDPFIKRWHDLFVHVWKGKTNYEGLIADPLFAPLHEMLQFEDVQNADYGWEYSVGPEVVMGYITQVICWARLTMLDGTDEDPFSGADYWTKNVLIWNVLPENWAAEKFIGFKNFGERVYKLFTVRIDADPQSEEYQQAYKLAWHLLSQACMQKVTHGKGIVHGVQLGYLWDHNDGKDCEPGTFGELIRYGTTHFEQTRESIAYKDAPKPPKTLRKGLLEV